MPGIILGPVMWRACILMGEWGMPPHKQEMNEQDNPKVVVYEESKTVMSSENELCRVVDREVLSDYLTS